MRWPFVRRSRYEKALAELDAASSTASRRLGAVVRFVQGRLEFRDERSSWVDTDILDLYEECLDPVMRYMDIALAQAGYRNMLLKNVSIVARGAD